MQEFFFFSRDISWLLFNERVLNQAFNKEVPLLEKIKFLSIFSSNLDEFYRVRMPALLALQRVETNNFKKDGQDELLKVQQLIQSQLQQFGQALNEIIPALKQQAIHLIYNEDLPEIIKPQLNDYFYTQILAFLQPVDVLNIKKKFFPENNKPYLVVVLQNKIGEERFVIINIPSDNLPRFYSVNTNGIQYIIFLDDIIKYHLPEIFKHDTVKGAYSFKITRDAVLDLKDDFNEDVAMTIEKEIAKRDAGLATRFLYQPTIPLRCLETLIDTFNLSNAGVVAGGNYHNLRDFATLPINGASFSYNKWPAVSINIDADKHSLFDAILQKDIILHTPYQSYDTILRFFNEAAMDVDVEEVYVTLYRVAGDSRIVNALISAAKNGKKVYVLVELKARFDEANNIKWAKRMKDAGVNIIYSPASLKVHAKVALVKKKDGDRIVYLGLLSTGNLNESTAKYYTDHILLTAHKGILREIEMVFIFLKQRKKKAPENGIPFQHLLVAQFNLQDKFIALIDREINNAKQGLPASIIIKLNNLEERVLISKLYEASKAGVKIDLIVRSICCLIPGVENRSANISIKRIVDRYLEHGRIFIFNNNGNTEVFMGSADWMNRNIYRRIEVCFPIYDGEIKKELLDIINLQLNDNVQAVMLDSQLNNVPIITTDKPVQAQLAIYELIKN